MQALKAEKAQALEQYRADLTVLAGGLAKEFSQANHERMQTLLTPVREAFDAFGKKVQETYAGNVRDTSALREMITQLNGQNQLLAQQANELASALRGDPQIQGAWGELQVERLLEVAGLQPDIHYIRHQSFTNGDGGRLVPDFIIKLTEGKCIVLDSKVSLVAFEKYWHAKDDAERAKYTQEHNVSVNKHLRELSTKNYQMIDGLRSPDFVFMFIPVEFAFLLTVREDMKLLEKALERNIVIVSPNTLLAALRTVAMIWRHESQHANAEEIAREAGRLLDKFAGFSEDMEGIARGIEATRNAYNAAVNKLHDSPRRGGTILGRLEKMQALGAHATKPITEPKSIE